MLDWGLNNGASNGENGGGKVEFAKFPEGVTRIRLLLEQGERPFMRWAHWFPQFNRKITCAGKGCPVDEVIKKTKDAGGTPVYNSTRAYAINIWNYDTNQHEILENGITMIEGLQDSLAEWYEDGDAKGPIQDLVIKVRKKKNSSGKWAWSFSLEDTRTPEDFVLKAIENKVNFEEYFRAPSIEQMNQLLAVNEPTKEDYLKAYMEIMGYNKKDNSSEGSIGTEIEVD